MATKLDNKTPLGQLILKELYLKGKNQAWLAEQIQVSPNHICILCSKIKNPKTALDVDVTKLYKAVAETVHIKSNNF